MKKVFYGIFIIFASLVLNDIATAETQNVCKENVGTLQSTKTNFLEDEKAESVKKFIQNFEKKQNSHKIIMLKPLYTDDFMNTDGYNKEQLFDLIQKTFKSYPDIQTVISIENIIVTGDFAMVLTKQNVNATTKESSKITGDKGEYSAILFDIMYLKNVSGNWKIYSENVISENSRLAYGKAKNITAKLNSPQKVFADTDYTVGLTLDVPVGFSAIASINNTQIVKGHNLYGETFRQVSPDDTSLERILRANNSSNNEAVVISIGFTETSQDIFKKPKVDISGLLMLMQRVDVIPANENNKKGEICAKK